MGGPWVSHMGADSSPRPSHDARFRAGVGSKDTGASWDRGCRPWNRGPVGAGAKARVQPVSCPSLQRAHSAPRRSPGVTVPHRGPAAGDLRLSRREVGPHPRPGPAACTKHPEETPAKPCPHRSPGAARPLAAAVP